MKYEVWCPDLGSTEEDAKEIEAFDAESAAERWADEEDCESADYWIVCGTPANVCVRDGEKVRTFTVHGETIAAYRAYEQTP